jgi:hypothetical protein
MGKKQIYGFAFLAIVTALPLAALDLASIKHGTPVRRGQGWEQRSEFETPVKEGAKLLFRAGAGAVEIHPEPGDKVKCVVILRANTSDAAAARRIFDRFQLSSRSLETGGVYIATAAPGIMQSRNLSIQFQISVPPRFNLDVETLGGDVTVGAPLDGEARLITAGGDIHTTDMAGPVRVETAGGSIVVGKIDSHVDARTAGGLIHVGDVKGDANLETSGGEIAVGQVGGILHAATAGGDVIIAGAAGKVAAQTAGGQIHIGLTSSSVLAETAGGSISLAGARGRVVAETAGGSIDLLQIESAVQASTASGRILAQFNPTKKSFGSSQLVTRSGDVYVYLPIGLPLTIDAAINGAAGHKIQSDFPITIQGGKEELNPGTIRGQGALNGGGEVLKIRTVAGDIEIRKLDAQALRELLQKEQLIHQAWEEGRAAKERHRQERDQARQQRQRERAGNDDDR